MSTLSTYSRIAEPNVAPSCSQVRYALPANVGAVVGVYLLLFAVSFIVLITFNPGFVQQSNPPIAGVAPTADLGKAFVISLIVSLILCIIIYLFLLAF